MFSSFGLGNDKVSVNFSFGNNSARPIPSIDFPVPGDPINRTCLLCSAAIIDIIAIIISYSNLANNWDIPPLLYVRLVILIFYYVILVSGFLVLKFTIDSLYKNNYIPRKGQWYIPVGIAVYFIPTIINWYSLVVYPNELYNWIQNVSLSLFFFAAFLIILGFFGLSVTMNMFRSGEYLNEELIENNEISDVEKNEEIET